MSGVTFVTCRLVKAEQQTARYLLMPLPTYQHEDQLSLAELIQKVVAVCKLAWAERKTILVTVAIAQTLGLFLAFGGGVEYTASARLIPYRNGPAGAGALSGLAGLAGIRLQAGSGDQALSVDLYPEVAKSLDFLLVVAETPITFGSLEKKATVVEYFRDLRKPPLTEIVWDYTVGLPSTLLSAVAPPQSSHSGERREADTPAVLAAFDNDYLELVNVLQERLSVSIDRKTSVITITGRMPDAVASADLVRVVSDRLMERIIDFESRKAGEQFRFVDSQYRRARARFDTAQRALALFSDRNRVLMSASSQIERSQLQRENDLAFEVLQQLSRELEQARIKMNQDSPVFATLEHVHVPASRTSPRRKQVLAAAFIIGMLAGFGQVLVRRLMLVS